MWLDSWDGMPEAVVGCKQREGSRGSSLQAVHSGEMRAFLRCGLQSGTWCEWRNGLQGLQKRYHVGKCE